MWKIFLLFQEQQEVPSVSWKQFKPSDWSESTSHTFLTCDKQRGEAWCWHSPLISGSFLPRPLALCYPQCLVLDLLSRDTRLASVWAPQLCSKTPKYFSEALKALSHYLSCSHGNMALWLFVEWPSDAAKFSKMAFKAVFEVCLHWHCRATFVIKFIALTVEKNICSESSQVDSEIATLKF